MIYEGISFNEAFYKDKTEADFIKREKHHFENDKNGTVKLKEAYALLNPKGLVSKNEDAAE